MQMQLPYYDYGLKVSPEDKVSIAELVEEGLRNFQGQRDQLEALALECVSGISNSDSISAEIAEQEALGRFLGKITGRSQKLHDALHRSSANVLYAQQQILTRLMEQDATIMDCVAAIHKETNTILLDVTQKQLETDQHLRQAFLHLLENRNAVIRLSTEHENLSREMNYVVFACPQCGSYIKRKSKICHSCGALLESSDASLTTEQASRRLRGDLNRLAAVIQKIRPKNAAFSGSKLDSYRQKIRQIQYYVQNAGFPSDIQEDVLEQCAEFQRFLEKQHIEIAIAGTVKAGKSSLINALLEMEFATVNATPETSVLTKYRTTRGKNYLKVRFFPDSEWLQIWREAQGSSIYLNEYRELQAYKEKARWVGRKDYREYGFTIPELQRELNRFISSKSPVHFFVKDVEVGIQSGLFPDDVCLVDTPGLDDVVATRSNVTKKYLDSADAVLACIKEKDIHEASETEFISRVMANRRDWGTLFVVATQKDLDKPSDCTENCAYFVTNVLDQMFNPSRERTGRRRHRAEQNFFGVSAKLYTYALSYGQKDLDDEDYDEFLSMLLKLGFREPSRIYEQLDDIKNASGIPFLRKNLEGQLFNNTRRNLHARMDEAFQDFLKKIHILVTDNIEALYNRLKILDNNETERAEIQKRISEAEAQTQELADHMKQVHTILLGGKS